MPELPSHLRKRQTIHVHNFESDLIERLNNLGQHEGKEFTQLLEEAVNFFLDYKEDVDSGFFEKYFPDDTFNEVGEED